jgi:hypothetical protein
MLSLSNAHVARIGSLLTISFYDRKEAIVETHGMLVEKIKEREDGKTSHKS